MLYLQVVFLRFDTWSHDRWDYPFKGQTIISTQVKTTQVAPTILKVLGLDPSQLQAVQKEGTVVLPGLF